MGIPKVRSVISGDSTKMHPTARSLVLWRSFRDVILGSSSRHLSIATALRRYSKLDYLSIDSMTITMPSRVEESIAPFPDDVPVADIYTVDFDKLSAGDAEEARKVYDASRGYGFFYLSNTHVDHEFMFDLANETFKLPLDEKMKYEMGNMGGYFGYKMSGSNYVDSKGTPDKSEFYNISRDDVFGNGEYKDNPLEHPETIKRRKGELEEFMRSAHRVVLVILKVLGEQLGLEPGVLPDLHKIDQVGGDQARVTHAPPVSSDVITLGEHTGQSWCGFMSPYPEVHLLTWEQTLDR
jgi:hypothetical protein